MPVVEGKWHMNGILQYISFGVGLLGVAVIVWGTLVTLRKILALELSRLRGANICPKRELMRHHYGSYILLGLEFLIAADIVRTIIQPELAELAALGAIVVIRTILSYFLNKEMQDHVCSVPGK